MLSSCSAIKSTLFCSSSQEWWNIVSSFEFDADASTGHAYSLVINEDMEVKTFYEWDMQVAPTKFHGIWRLGTRGGAGAHNWPVGYAGQC